MRESVCNKKARLLKHGRAFYGRCASLRRVAIRGPTVPLCQTIAVATQRQERHNVPARAAHAG